MAAANRLPRLLAPALNQFLKRHARIVYKAPKAHVLTPHTACDPAQASTARAKHTTKKRRPPLSRRRSPKRPNDKFWAVCMCDPPVESFSTSESLRSSRGNRVHPFRVNM